MISFENTPRSFYAGSFPSDMLMHEVADVRSVEVARNVKIGYTALNRHLIGDAKPIISIGAFLSDLTTPDRAYEGVQLASLERPVFMLDLPGHGLSTPHSTKQIADLCIRRSSDSQARPLVEATQKLIPDSDKVDYFGISHGAHMSMKATELDPIDRVDTVFGVDLPAVKRRFTVGLQAGYIVADNLIGRRKYLEQLRGTVYEADFEQFKAVHEAYGVQRVPSFVANNKGLFIANLFTSINARPVALESWRTVLESKSARIELVTAERSSVTDHEVIAEFINQQPHEYAGRSHQTVISDEDHNIGITHLLPRAVQWAATAYSKSAR